MRDTQTKTTLGSIIRDIRKRNGWTLKEMSQHSGIPLSTISKVEHDRLTLTYDKLQQLGQRLDKGRWLSSVWNGQPWVSRSAR